jgi:hypothetical protein
MWDDEMPLDDADWWQQQDSERQEYEFIRTILLATLIAVFKELEATERKLQ